MSFFPPMGEPEKQGRERLLLSIIVAAPLAHTTRQSSSTSVRREALGGSGEEGSTDPLASKGAPTE